MLTAWSWVCSSTARAAARVPPATSAEASCMSAKTGLSIVPRPCSGSGRPVLPASLTASRYDGACTRVSKASSAGVTPSSVMLGRSMTPSARANAKVSSTRTGLSGWLAPKSYSTSAGSHGTATARLTTPSCPQDRRDLSVGQPQRIPGRDRRCLRAVDSVADEVVARGCVEPVGADGVPGRSPAQAGAAPHGDRVLVLPVLHSLSGTPGRGARVGVNLEQNLAGVSEGDLSVTRNRQPAQLRRQRHRVLAARTRRAGIDLAPTSEVIGGVAFGGEGDGRAGDRRGSRVPTRRCHRSRRVLRCRSVEEGRGRCRGPPIVLCLRLSLRWSRRPAAGARLRCMAHRCERAGGGRDDGRASGAAAASRQGEQAAADGDGRDCSGGQRDLATPTTPGPPAYVPGAGLGGHEQWLSHGNPPVRWPGRYAPRTAVV